MANRKKKRKPKQHSNAKKKQHCEPFIIIQKQSETKAAWIILIAETLKCLNLIWVELKELIINFFSSL